MGTFREIAGFFLLAAGMIGDVVPIIPGIPLLLAGGVLLAPKYPRIRTAMEWVRHWLAMAKERWQSRSGFPAGRRKQVLRTVAGNRK